MMSFVKSNSASPEANSLCTPDPNRNAEIVMHKFTLAHIYKTLPLSIYICKYVCIPPLSNKR